MRVRINAVSKRSYLGWRIHTVLNIMKNREIVLNDGIRSVIRHNYRIDDYPAWEAEISITVVKFIQMW